MKILVINCGSSSIKYKLFEFPQKKLIAKGLIERIGERGSAISTHRKGIEVVFERLIKGKAINGLDEINGIGHRVVHGAETFKKPQLVDKSVMRKISECFSLAPLHNPKNYAGIIGCKKIMPRTLQVAVFDTAFHQTISPYAYIYAIPMRYYKKYGVRKYGFHGTSHQFVATMAARALKKPLSKLKLITCHLGNGCSITAINKGKSIDTSMGFTPLEGLAMGTRCGDIDVAAVFYIMEKGKISVHEMDEILNKKSGILGVSGISNDMRVIRKEMRNGNRLCRLALDIFIHRIKKYIGAYYLILGGADAICFTAGISEHCHDIIARLKRDIQKVVSKETKILVIPTDEELMIATLTYELIKRRKK